MPITQADLTSGASVALTPMVLTDSLKGLLTSIIDNIGKDKTAIANLNQGTEDKYNEVIATVNAIQAGSEIDLSGFETTIGKIIELETGNSGSFLTAFETIATELDRRKETNAFRTTITASPLGKVTVDVSGYGFASVDDFKVIVKVPTQDGKNISATAKVVSTTSVEVTLRDEDVFQDSTIATSFYDAATSGAIEVVMMVVHTATPIGLTIDSSAFDAATVPALTKVLVEFRPTAADTTSTPKKYYSLDVDGNQFAQQFDPVNDFFHLVFKNNPTLSAQKVYLNDFTINGTGIKSGTATFDTVQVGLESGAAVGLTYELVDFKYELASPTTLLTLGLVDAGGGVFNVVSNSFNASVSDVTEVAFLTELGISSLADVSIKITNGIDTTTVPLTEVGVNGTTLFVNDYSTKTLYYTLVNSFNGSELTPLNALGITI